LNYNLRLDK